MITGFNTDIERDGVVYHVQTEDKGLDSPLILSLVYSGGEILAAKRTPYQDLISAGFTDEALAERLKRQHRLICAAINAGRIEELKQMSSRREAAARAPSPPPAKGAPREPIAPPATVDPALIAPIVPVAKVQQPPIETIAPTAPAPVQIYDEFILETSAERPLAKEWEQPVEDEVAKARALEPPNASSPTPFDPPPPTFSAPRESAYTVYDSRRPSRPKKTAKRDDELALTILDDEEFRAGASVTIRVLLQRHVRNEEKPLGGVVISIKVLGATFRPQLYSIKTQRDGVAVVPLDLPSFTSGRAAVVIRAEAHEQSVELRRVIHPAG